MVLPDKCMGTVKDNKHKSLVPSDERWAKEQETYLALILLRKKWTVEGIYANISITR